MTSVVRIIGSGTELFLDLLVLVLPRRVVHALVVGVCVCVYTTVYVWRWHYEAKAVQLALGVSFRRALGIAFRGYCNLMTFLVDYRYFAMRSDKNVLDLTRAVRVEGQSHLEAALASERPVILTSIHMGSFLIGFLKLCALSPKNRVVTVIKQNDISPKETRAYAKFQRQGIPFVIRRLKDKPGVAAFQALREGNLLFVLCDVDPAFGKTVGVPFLGKQAVFPCGVAELALASKAMILPLAVYRDRDADTETQVLKIEAAIDPTTYNGHFHEKGLSVTEALVHRVESWIRQWPEQWQSWAVLPNMWKEGRL